MIEDGILLVDKPANMTSFGVVARVRRQLTQHYGHRVKVGHTGTLDPFATGLMILVIGKECKNASQYSKLDKVYQATITLGETSSTGDPEGEITHVSDGKPTKQEIETVLKAFIGEIEQTPPIYSAIKIDGQRAYKLARKGEKVEMPRRKVTIYSIKLVQYNYPNVMVETHVSSGTYIRTLAEDIGKKITTGAYCAELRRTQIGAHSINELSKDKSSAIVLT